MEGWGRGIRGACVFVFVCVRVCVCLCVSLFTDGLMNITPHSGLWENTQVTGIGIVPRKKKKAFNLKDKPRDQNDFG